VGCPLFGERRRREVEDERPDVELPEPVPPDDVLGSLPAPGVPVPDVVVPFVPEVFALPGPGLLEPVCCVLFVWDLVVPVPVDRAPAVSADPLPGLGVPAEPVDPVPVPLDPVPVPLDPVPVPLDPVPALLLPVEVDPVPAALAPLGAPACATIVPGVGAEIDCRAGVE
jgi:signal-induced proliferation-associated 1 like protein 3